MFDVTRYVAIREDEKTSQTFVVAGNITLNELFKMINDRPITLAGMMGKIRSISIHRDESLEQTSWVSSVESSQHQIARGSSVIRIITDDAPPPKMPKREFYEWVGRCITEWANVNLLSDANFRQSA
jgi:hypothetical protein